MDLLERGPGLGRSGHMHGDSLARLIAWVCSIAQSYVVYVACMRAALDVFGLRKSFLAKACATEAFHTVNMLGTTYTEAGTR